MFRQNLCSKSLKLLAFGLLVNFSVISLLACGGLNHSPATPALPASPTSSLPVFNTAFSGKLNLRGGKKTQEAIEGLNNKTLTTKITTTRRLNSLGEAKTQVVQNLQELTTSLEAVEANLPSSKIKPLLANKTKVRNFKTGLAQLQNLTEELLLTQAQLVKAKKLQVELDHLREDFVRAKTLLNQLLSLQNRLTKTQRLLELARLNLGNAYAHNWSFRKEVLLYLLTFKWFWGVFTGYAPSTSYSQESYQVEILTKQLEELSLSLSPQIADLSKRLRLELAALLEKSSWLRNLALSFRDTFRLGWGLKQLVELFERLLAAEEAYEASRQSFEELVAGRVLARSEVFQYLDDVTWFFNSDFTLSTHWESKTVGETEFVVSAFENEQGSNEAHKDKSETGGEVTKGKKPEEVDTTSASSRKNGELCFANSSTSYSLPKPGKPGETVTLLQGCTSSELTQKSSNKSGFPIAIGELTFRGVRELIPFAFSSTSGPTWTFRPQKYISVTESWNAQARLFFANDLQVASQNRALQAALLSKAFSSRSALDLVTPLELLLSAGESIRQLEAKEQELLQQIHERQNDLAKFQKEINFEELAKQAAKRAYTPKTFEVFKQQEKNSKWKYGVALKGFVVLREILESSLESRKAYEEVLELEKQERLAIDRVLIAQAGVEKADDINWRTGKEVVLYLFGFKWLWGMFTGYATSTSTSKESRALRKVREELEELRNKNAQLFPKLIAEFERNFKKTLSLVEESRKWFVEERSFSATIGAFEEGFKNAFLERDFNRGEFQRIYRLFSEELMLGRRFYYTTGKKKVAAENVSLLPPVPSIVENLLATKRLETLSSMSENWRELDLEKKVRAFNQVKEEEVRSQQNFEEFFDTKQVQLMANYIDEFDRSVNLYKRLRVRLFLAAKTLEKTFEAGEDDFSEFLPLSKDLLALSLATSFSSFYQEREKREETTKKTLEEETNGQERASSDLPALLEEQEGKDEESTEFSEEELITEKNSLPSEDVLIPGDELFPEFSGFFREEDIHLFPGEKPKTSQEVMREEAAKEQENQAKTPSTEETTESFPKAEEQEEGSEESSEGKAAKEEENDTGEEVGQEKQGESERKVEKSEEIEGKTEE